LVEEKSFKRNISSGIYSLEELGFVMADWYYYYRMSILWVI
jgi:hypothetical protein